MTILTAISEKLMTNISLLIDTVYIQVFKGFSYN